MSNPGEITTSSSNMGHNIQICAFLAIPWGPGCPINKRTGPILLPSYPLIYIIIHIKYGSNPVRIFVSYRENDEVSVDAADAADAADDDVTTIKP